MIHAGLARTPRSDDRGVRPPLRRADFPVLGRSAYLDNATVGATPVQVLAAMDGCNREIAASGTLAALDWLERLQGVRAAAAGLLGVPPADVALVKNTTEGLAVVAGGMPWEPGDRVVVPAGGFASTSLPWLALRGRGVVVDRVLPRGTAGALPTEAFADVLAAGPPARMVVVSWVGSATGWRVDLPSLARLVHDQGGLLCVDAIQGLGVVPAAFQRWGVDFASAHAYKWMLGPAGIGVLYVRDTHRELLRPTGPGWMSVVDGLAPDPPLVFHDSARRFEGGLPNISGGAGLGAALELLASAGAERVWEHVQRLTTRLRQGLERAGAQVLTAADPAHGSGILVVSVPGHDPATLSGALAREGFACSPRGAGLGVAPHGFSSDDDIDGFVAAIAGRCA